LFCNVASGTRWAAKKPGISNEQVCVLVARDRDKMTFSHALGMGRLTKEQLDRSLVKDSYFRKELIDNNIIDKNYVQKLLDIEKWKAKDEEKKLKEKRYAEYLKMKKEFEE
jgi:hypothetical protein